jgi:hypothetical protein
VGEPEKEEEEAAPAPKAGVEEAPKAGVEEEPKRGVEDCPKTPVEVPPKREVPDCGPKGDEVAVVGLPKGFGAKGLFWLGG